jgi:hypothetical protein
MYLEWFAKEHKIETMDDWYKYQRVDFENTGGMGEELRMKNNFRVDSS